MLIDYFGIISFRPMTIKIIELIVIKVLTLIYRLTRLNCGGWALTSAHLKVKLLRWKLPIINFMSPYGVFIRELSADEPTIRIILYQELRWVLCYITETLEVYAIDVRRYLLVVIELKGFLWVNGGFLYKRLGEKWLIKELIQILDWKFHFLVRVYT